MRDTRPRHFLTLDDQFWPMHRVEDDSSECMLSDSMSTTRNQRTSTNNAHVRELVGRDQEHPLSFCFFIFIRCIMQIVAIVAMRALVSRLAAHDAELSAHDSCTIRELKTREQRLPQARYASSPNDSVDRDRPRLTYDVMQCTKTKVT
jgi:hypothetical protein